MTVSRHQVTAYSCDDDPLTVGFVKNQHLRAVNGSYEDGYIESLIAASLLEAQHQTERTILPETWRLDLSEFPSCGVVYLPFPPLIEVTSVVNVDADGVETTVDADVYEVVTPYGPRAHRGCVRLSDGQSWPTTATRSDAIRITFRCGYVDGSVSPEVISVPAPITHARLLLITDLYEHRSSATVGAGNTIALNVQNASVVFKRYRDPDAEF